eukprot:jgi/Chrpa1/26740/Chrysochromulina_OHIO_Genome00017186-RA
MHDAMGECGAPKPERAHGATVQVRVLPRMLAQLEEAVRQARLARVLRRRGRHAPVRQDLVPAQELAPSGQVPLAQLERGHLGSPIVPAAQPALEVALDIGTGEDLEQPLEARGLLDLLKGHLDVEGAVDRAQALEVDFAPVPPQGIEAAREVPPPRLAEQDPHDRANARLRGPLREAHREQLGGDVVQVLENARRQLRLEARHLPDTLPLHESAGQLLVRHTRGHRTRRRAQLPARLDEFHPSAHAQRHVAVKELADELGHDLVTARSQAEHLGPRAQHTRLESAAPEAERALRLALLVGATPCEAGPPLEAAVPRLREEGGRGLAQGRILGSAMDRGEAPTAKARLEGSTAPRLEGMLHAAREARGAAREGAPRVERTPLGGGGLSAHEIVREERDGAQHGAELAPAQPRGALEAVLGVRGRALKVAAEESRELGECMPRAHALPEQYASRVAANRRGEDGEIACFGRPLVQHVRHLLLYGRLVLVVAEGLGLEQRAREAPPCTERELAQAEKVARDADLDLPLAEGIEVRIVAPAQEDAQRERAFKVQAGRQHPEALVLPLAARVAPAHQDELLEARQKVVERLAVLGLHDLARLRQSPPEEHHGAHDARRPEQAGRSLLDLHAHREPVLIKRPTAERLRRVRDGQAGEHRRLDAELGHLCPRAEGGRLLEAAPAQPRPGEQSLGLLQRPSSVRDLERALERLERGPVVRLLVRPLVPHAEDDRGVAHEELAQPLREPRREMRVEHPDAQKVRPDALTTALRHLEGRLLACEPLAHHAQPRVERGVEHLAEKARDALLHLLALHHKAAPRERDPRQGAVGEHRVGPSELSHLHGALCRESLPPTEHAERARVGHATQDHAQLEHALVLLQESMEPTRCLHVEEATPKGERLPVSGRLLIEGRYVLAAPGHPAARELAAREPAHGRDHQPVLPAQGVPSAQHGASFLETEQRGDAPELEGVLVQLDEGVEGRALAPMHHRLGDGRHLCELVHALLRHRRPCEPALRQASVHEAREHAPPLGLCLALGLELLDELVHRLGKLLVAPTAVGRAELGTLDGGLHRLLAPRGERLALARAREERDGLGEQQPLRVLVVPRGVPCAQVLEPARRVRRPGRELVALPTGNATLSIRVEGEQHLESEAAHPEADGAARGLALLLLELDEAQPAGEDERLQLVEHAREEREHLHAMREAIRGHQRQSEVIRGNQRSSEAIRGHQRQSEVIRGHQRPSEVIRGNQRSSEDEEREHLFSHGRDLMHHAAPAAPRHREEPVAKEAKRLTHLGLALGEGLGAPPPLGEPVAEQ